MSTDVISPTSQTTASSHRSPTARRTRKNRMSAIRVWSDSGDQGLELLVAPHVSDEQQIASKMASLRTALENCREQINNEPSTTATATAASTDSSAAPPPLAESSVRLRGILTELNTLDKQISNKGISYVSEESSEEVTEADLPPASGELAGKPTHRHVAAMRQLCQDLLLKCEAGKKAVTHTTNGTTTTTTVLTAADGASKHHPESEEKVDEAKRNSISVVASPSTTQTLSDGVSSTPHTLSTTSSFTPTAATSPTSADEDKAVVGATVAAALKAEPMRNTAEGARAAAEAEQRAQNRKVGGGNGQKSGDVFIISRWGELLREPKKPLTQQQLRKKRGQITNHIHQAEHTPRYGTEPNVVLLLR